MKCRDGGRVRIREDINVGVICGFIKSCYDVK